MSIATREVTSADKAPSLVDSGEPLVDLSAFPFVMAPAYHWRGWTQEHRLLLREGMARRLLESQGSALEGLGWRWIVYDAWRPRSLQARIWSYAAAQCALEHPEWDQAQLRDQLSRWVADPFDPLREPAHSTGGAVDLGIWDLSAGAPVDLGAGFDEFTPAAALDYFEHPDRLGHPAARARSIMRGAIEGSGMRQHPWEYFHVDYGTLKWAQAVGSERAFYAEASQNGGVPEAVPDPSSFPARLAAPFDMAPWLLRAGAQYCNG